MHFARNSVHDGFFQRFLITAHLEVFVKMDDKEEMIKGKYDTKLIDLNTFLEVIYKYCSDHEVKIHLSEEAIAKYKSFHDYIVEYCQEDLYEEDKLSIKSKSLGQTLRVTGVVCLMREALLAMRDENYVFNHMITGEDFDNEFCTYKRLCFKTITWDETKRNENI